VVYIFNIITHIYCSVVLCVRKSINYTGWILITYVILNSLHLLFTIGDLWMMLKNNEREGDGWFFDMMYGIIAGCPLIVYWVPGILSLWYGTVL